MQATLVDATLADRLYGVAARVVFPMIWLGARVGGVPAEQLRARTGMMPVAPRPLVWFHGASAGELTAAAYLAGALQQSGYRFVSAYTAANAAGVELGARVAGPAGVAAFSPWDHPRWVARAFDHWQPRVLVLVETELWPRLILEAARRHIPAFSVSARIYPRDMSRYRAIRPLAAPMLRRLTQVLAQNEVERERFIALGACPQRCSVGGNLKHLGPDSARAAASARDQLRSDLGCGQDDRIVAFGSVHADEISFVFAALDRLRLESWRAIIAPRHAGAVPAIASAARQRGWRCQRRFGDLRPRRSSALGWKKS
jgi:3-deoxy-D-manno-octulosonic-acid transferase